MSKNPLLFNFFEKFIIPTLDVLTFMFSFLLASFIRFKILKIDHLSSPAFLGMIAITLFAFYILDNYKIENKVDFVHTGGRVFFATLVSSIFIIILVYLLGYKRYMGDWFGRGILPMTMFVFTLMASFTRISIDKIFISYHTNSNWLILDNIGKTQTFYQDFISIFGKTNLVILTDQINTSSDTSNLPTIDYLYNIEKWINKKWAAIIVCNKAKIDSKIIKTLMQKRLQGVKVYDLVDFYENVWFKVPIDYLEDGWFATSSGFTLIHNNVNLKIKRIFDIVFAILLLIFTFPLIVLTYLLIKIFDKGPAIYKQKRTGEKETIFTIYKFRTMNIDAEIYGHKWTDLKDSRITFIGKLLRITRIDELPQCLNVLKGEMSFIGPRPERPEFNEELEKDIPYYSLRTLIKPGITGWAQILYPYGASKQDALEKLKYDLYYIKNYSLLMDFMILLKTARIIFFGKGR